MIDHVRYGGQDDNLGAFEWGVVKVNISLASLVSNNDVLLGQ